MRLKSYFADSVPAAMEKARNELGPEAMLISSQETSRDLKDLGSYEVVFGLAQGDSAADAAASSEPSPRSAYRSAPEDAVLRELADLRRKLEHLGQSVTRSSISRATEKFTPELSRHFDRLLNAGFSPEFAQELVEAAAQRTSASSDTPLRALRNTRDPFARDLFEAVLRAEIENRFTVAPSLGDTSASASQAVVFVGAPGAGKTASLVKLGLEYGVKARRPLHLWSFDTLRVGGCDQLAKYARLSGAEFRPLSDAATLSAALARCAPDSLVLIDTPGFSSAEVQELQHLAQSLRPLPVEVQLVLPACLSLDAAQKAAQRFAAFFPSKLLLTHMDEAASPACAVELAARLELPLSFLGTGQQIPEDLSVADKAALLKLLTTPEQAARGVGA